MATKRTPHAKADPAAATVGASAGVADILASIKADRLEQIGESLELAEQGPASAAFQAKVVEARGHFDLFLSHRENGFLFAAFSAIRKAEALIAGAQEELRSLPLSPSLRLQAFNVLREKILAEMTTYAESQMVGSLDKVPVQAKAKASLIVRAMKEEYARVHVHQKRWLARPAGPTRPPSGVAAQVLARVCQRLGVTSSNAFRAWSVEFLSGGPDERHMYRSLVDEVEAMHERIEAQVKQSATKDKPPRGRPRRLEISRPGKP